MAVCETCGNDYDKAFTVKLHDGSTHVFDSFECAIQGVAPTCATCGVRVVGHDLEADGVIYCCENCASRDGVEGLEDRV